MTVAYSLLSGILKFIENILFKTPKVILACGTWARFPVRTMSFIPLDLAANIASMPTDSKIRLKRPKAMSLLVATSETFPKFDAVILVERPGRISFFVISLMRRSILSTFCKFYNM